MAIDTRNQDQLSTTNNRAALWTIIGLIALAAIAYGAYASYKRSDTIDMQSGRTSGMMGTSVTTRPSTSATGTTGSGSGAGSQ